MRKATRSSCTLTMGARIHSRRCSYSRRRPHDPPPLPALRPLQLVARREQGRPHRLLPVLARREPEALHGVRDLFTARSQAIHRRRSAPPSQQRARDAQSTEDCSMTDTDLAKAVRDDIRRCLDDVATEFRARGRDDTRFMRLIARMDSFAAHESRAQPASVSSKPVPIPISAGGGICKTYGYDQV